MPYVTCPSCSLSAYTAARFSTVDECARCGTPLRSVGAGPGILPAEASGRGMHDAVAGTGPGRLAAA